MVIEASFEDFLYIILGLAWVIYSAYSAKKKQNAKKNPASAKKNNSFLESLINEIGIKPEQTKPITNTTTHDVEYYDSDFEPEEIAEEEPRRLFSYDDEYEESNYKSSFNVIDTESEETITEVPSKEVVKFNSTKKDFYSLKKKHTKKRIDLRRAVIYSIILKREYF